MIVSTAKRKQDYERRSCTNAFCLPRYRCNLPPRFLLVGARMIGSAKMRPAVAPRGWLAKVGTALSGGLFHCRACFQPMKVVRSTERNQPRPVGCAGRRSLQDG